MAKPAMQIRQERWTSTRGFLAASIGSAVGLGNIWRFPYMAGENGGGTFLVPYLVGILLCGIPLMAFEIAAGRHYRQGIVGAVQSIRPQLWLLGAGVALIGFIFLSYYLVITGWTLGYLVATPLGLNTDFSSFSNSWSPLVFFFLSALVSVLIVSLGVSHGIERVSKILLPLLVAIVFLMAGYGLTLNGWDQALAFLFQPQLDNLLNPQVWANGFGQAFFSLGVGLGVMVTYGSYVGEDASITRSVLAVSGADTVIALIAGLAIFPIVFTFGYSPSAGPQLAFETLPRIFSEMPLGTLVGSAFYLLLFLAATTSAVSLLEMVVRSLSDRLSWSHLRSLALIIAPLLVMGAISALSYSPVRLSIGGLPVLDLLDSIMGTFGLLMGGLLTCIALFWVSRPDGLIYQVDRNNSFGIGRVGFFLGRYVLPLALIFLLISSAVALT